MHLYPRESLKQYSARAFIRERAPKFQEVDAAGIIFYPRVLEYFHDHFTAFLEHAGAPLAEVLKAGEWIAPVRHAEVDYFRPLRFGDVVEIALLRAHLEISEVTLGFRITKLGSSDVTAVGQVVHAFVEPRNFTRIPIPEMLKTALEQIGDA